MEKINKRIEELTTDQSCDIGEHLPYLKKMAAKCNRVVELGTRDGNSTIALYAGAKKSLISIDVAPFNGLHRDLIDKDGTKVFIFIQNSSLDIEIPDCELLFIDTEHTFEQLSEELKKHGNTPTKYIIFHDTVAFVTQLIPAITAFVTENPHWKIVEHFHNCNGLMTLKRIK